MYKALCVINDLATIKKTSALRQMVSAKGIIDPGRGFDDQGTARVSKETCINISNIRQVSLSRSWG